MEHKQYIKIYAGYPDEVESAISQHIHARVNAGLRIASISTVVMNPQEGNICTTVIYENDRPNSSVDAEELGYWIAKLEHYAKKAHNECAAEDLRTIADKLKELGGVK